MKAKLIKTPIGYYHLMLENSDYDYGHTSPEYCELQNRDGSYTHKLSLKNCQAIERGYDLDELSIKYASEFLKRPVVLYSPLEGNTSEVVAFQKGFKKALELLGDKIFTLDDIYTVFIMGREGMEDKMNRYVTRIHEPTEWDVEIEMEDTYVCGIQYGCDEDGCNHPNQVPYLDSEGCLILKII